MMETERTDRTSIVMHVPSTVQFADLKLQRRHDGQVSFDWAPILVICSASGLDANALRNGPEDNVGALIIAWYSRHREAGGRPDPVAEDLLAEAILEQSHGAVVSHRPGRA